MDIFDEVALINDENENKLKRKVEGCTNSENSEQKKIKLETKDDTNLRKDLIEEDKPTCSNTLGKCKVFNSPRKKLCIEARQINKGKDKYIYGNYKQYYGYRNKNSPDLRLDALHSRLDLFKNKRLLDIGCNNGFITIEIAKRFGVNHITGIDIDRKLIKQAYTAVTSAKKCLPWSNPERNNGLFPYNVTFKEGNYVLRDDVLLEIETSQFDTILCLSVTKWIHLNFGDNGLKQAFRRMYAQLVEGGVLILEAQPFDNYRRRKKLTVST